MLALLGYGSLDELVADAVPAGIREAAPLELPRAGRRGRGPGRAAGPGRPQPGRDLDDRPRLPRHRHAAGDPAQRAREPGLVHGLHAVPAGDLPGPARGAAQLPDHGRRPHRHGPGQRLAARRGHRRGRGHDPGPPGGQGPRRCRLRRRRRLPPADHRGGPDPGRAARHRGGRGRPGRRPARRRRRSACCAQYPGSTGLVRDDAAAGRGRARTRAPSWRSPPTCWPCACSARPARSGADVVVGSAQRFGVPLGFGGPHAGFMAVRDGLAALPARPPGRRVGRRRRRPGPTASPCRPASSTSAARRPPPTSAPPRCSWPSWPSLYAVYHGPDGLTAIADRAHRAAPRARRRPAGRRASTSSTTPSSTPSLVRVPGRADAVVAAALAGGVNLRRVDADHVAAITCDETTARPPRRRAGRVRRSGRGRAPGRRARRRPRGARRAWCGPRRSCTHPVFHRTAPRRRCCATCAASPTATSPSTGP